MSRNRRLEPEFCDHASGVVTVDSDNGLCCDDCGAPLVLVSRSYVEKLLADLQDCRRGITRWRDE